MFSYYYYFGIKITNFLIDGYNIITSWDLISTCLGLAALAILYEAMKIFQIKLRDFAKEHILATSTVQNTDSSSLISRVSEKSLGTFSASYCNQWTKCFIEIFHWCAHVTLGYVLMLAVMTFNGYISIALVFGSAIGYFVCGHILLELNMKKLQKRRKLVQCNPDCSDAIIDTPRRESTSTASDHSEVEVNINVDIHVKSED